MENGREPGGRAVVEDRPRRQGEAFQGLRALWRRGDETFAEVELPADAEPDRFGLHPALFDAALHAVGAGAPAEGPARLPFVWNDVALHATGARELRVRVVGGDAPALYLADTTGAAVATVGALHSRPVDTGALGAAAGSDALFTLEWVPAPAVEDLPPVPYAVLGAHGDSDGRGEDAGDPVAALESLLEQSDRQSDGQSQEQSQEQSDGQRFPDVVVLPVTPGTADAVAGLRTAARTVLATLRTWLADGRTGSARLLVLTDHAVPAARRCASVCSRPRRSVSVTSSATVDPPAAERAAAYSSRTEAWSCSARVTAASALLEAASAASSDAWTASERNHEFLTSLGAVPT
ncbi:polyketide synthase dehydratase domain-containing protein, partial [Streptomyces niveus]|uniref:polyketide synthase dehydratase domain-containing protein n=1 Tax=Streptomyces niveus TaxID=193462 RepID=UPI00343D1F2B